MKMKNYEIHARLPMTTAAKNAGATGRTHWWVLADKVKARNAKHACAMHRKDGRFAYCDKLRAILA